MKLSTMLFVGAFIFLYMILITTQLLPILNLKSAKMKKFSFNTINKMGKKIISFQEKKIPKKRNINILILSALLVYIGIIITKTYQLISILTIITSLITVSFISYKYTTIAGIYEKGIVYGDFIKWKKIHSWKIETNGKISILNKNGFRFTIDEAINVEKIIEVFKINNIEETT